MIAEWVRLRKAGVFNANAMTAQQQQLRDLRTWVENYAGALGNFKILFGFLVDAAAEPIEPFTASELDEMQSRADAFRDDPPPDVQEALYRKGAEEYAAAREGRLPQQLSAHEVDGGMAAIGLNPASSLVRSVDGHLQIGSAEHRQWALSRMVGDVADLRWAARQAFRAAIAANTQVDAAMLCRLLPRYIEGQYAPLEEHVLLMIEEIEVREAEADTQVETPDTSEWPTQKQAAQILGVSPGTVSKFVDAGKLRVANRRVDPLSLYKLHLARIGEGKDLREKARELEREAAVDEARRQADMAVMRYVCLSCKHTVAEKQVPCDCGSRRITRIPPADL